MAIAVIAFIVFIERSLRKILVQYPKRQHGNKVFGGEAQHLPLKINVPEKIPPIFASSLLLMPVSIINLTGGQAGGADWLVALNAMLGRGQPLYLAIYIGLIVFFAFFYTAIVFNPEDTADNLRRNGGYIPGIRPGQSTADYLGLYPDTLNSFGCSLSVCRMYSPRDPNQQLCNSVLFWGHIVADCGYGNTGYSLADSVSSHGSPV